MAASGNCAAGAPMNAYGRLVVILSPGILRSCPGGDLRTMFQPVSTRPCRLDVAQDGVW